MLKITIHNDAVVASFILEGTLTGEWVKELERCWRQEAAAPSAPRIQVELRDVGFVDEEGRELLRLMAKAGAELIAVGLVMKAIVEEIVASISADRGTDLVKEWRRMKSVSTFCIFLIVALLAPTMEAVAQTSTRAASSPSRDLVEIEMLMRAEHRAEALRVQLLDLQMKEIELQAQLEDLDYRLLPENIQKALAFVGSVRPMDELREVLRIRIENEKARVNRQLEILASSRERLESVVSEADVEVEFLRRRLNSQ
jgi:hypothetical protein